MTDTYLPGLGIDIGTSFLVAARQKTDGTVSFISERDAFFSIEPKTNQQMKLTEKMLVQRGAFTLKADNKLYVVGQHAIDIANERNAEVSRPLRRGVLTASDIDSFGMLAVVVEALVGKAQKESESCTYCFPADPIDADYDVLYHKKRLDEIFRSLGYNPRGILESEALVYSELMNEDLSGIAVSCGAGMFNFSLAYLGDMIISASVSRGGDWLDARVGKTFNLPESTVQAEKEAGLDLFSNYDKTTASGRLKKCMIDYYDELINYVVAVIATKLKMSGALPKFNKPISFIISGGTSLPNGFIEKFSLAVNHNKFPFEIGDIRRAADSLNAVANGCLIYSQIED